MRPAGVFILAFFFFGCNDIYHNLVPPRLGPLKLDPLSDENRITSFEIDGQIGEAVITGNTISIKVEEGTDLTEVIPRITVSPGAKLFPLDIAIDFSVPVDFLVTSEKGTVREYTVTVTGNGNGVTEPPEILEPTVIDIAEIPGITVPVTGGTPVKFTETEQYTGTVTWSPEIENETFAAETVHTATITLKAKPGLTLKGASENFFTVAGTTSATNDKNSGVVTAVFFPSIFFVTVTFDANGATGTVPDPMTANAGFDITLPDKGDLEREGYTFGGWITAPHGTGENYGEGESYMPTSDITLYARWYSTVTFNANGATGTVPSPMTANAGFDITLPDKGDLEREGYTFGGWNTELEGTGTNYDEGSSYVPTGNTKMHAWWIPVDMVWIPAGTFMMGSPEDEPGRFDDETQHQVTLTQGFYMGKYPVTQAQYEAVMGTNPGGDNPANRPVDAVSWYDAIVFCNKLSLQEDLSPAYRINGSTDPAAWGSVPTSDNATWDAVEIVTGSTGYRLPTEAQWEYACRAGTATAFNWGTDYIDESKANYNASHVDANNTVAGTYSERTTEVGSYAPNIWGLYDMHGNVLEWCWDWWTDDLGSETDPTGAVSGSFRVLRGGSFCSSSQFLRSGFRSIILYSEYPAHPSYQKYTIGFRLSRP
jgi:uncharacterized repeat protein (TIGR02543 family)